MVVYVRYASEGETLQLLDGRVIDTTDVLVIADEATSLR